MPLVIIRHKVKDYAAWRRAYDAHAGRKAAGFTNERVTRSADDPSELVLVLEAADLDKARAFCASDELKAAMQGAGVTDTPDIYYLKDA